MKNTTTQLKNEQKTEETTFHKIHTDANGHVRDAHHCSSLLIREMETKTHNGISPHNCQNGYHKKDHK